MCILRRRVGYLEGKCSVQSRTLVQDIGAGCAHDAYFDVGGPRRRERESEGSQDGGCGWWTGGREEN